MKDKCNPNEPEPSLLDEALDLLDQVEWHDAADYDEPDGVCGWCGGARALTGLGGLPVFARPGIEPGKHAPDCPWLALMRKVGRR